MDTLNNRSQNGEDHSPPPPVAALPMHVDAFHYANGSDGGEEAAAAPLGHASSAVYARTSELTISFEGEVYVFPAVTPQKVHFIPSQILYLIRTTPCIDWCGDLALFGD